MEENNFPEKKRVFTVWELQSSLGNCAKAMSIAVVDSVFILILCYSFMYLFRKVLFRGFYFGDLEGLFLGFQF